MSSTMTRCTSPRTSFRPSWSSPATTAVRSRADTSAIAASILPTSTPARAGSRILRDVVGRKGSARNLTSIIGSHFGPTHGVDLDLPPREARRELPSFE